MATLQEKQKGLTDVINSINKNAKSNGQIVGFASDEGIRKKLAIEYISVASLGLRDLFVGLPRGKTTIISGNEDSGKTSFVLETIARNQKEDPNFCALWVESEESLTDKHLEMFGVDTKRCVVIQHERTGAAEVLLDRVEAILATGHIDLCCINSLKCLVPSEEFKKQMGEHTIGLQARMNAKLMRKYTSLISEHDTAFVLITHLTTMIGKYNCA